MREAGYLAGMHHEAVAAHQAPAAGAPPFLSSLEWAAVTIALREADRTGGGMAAGGRLARAWRWLTGIQPPRPLADPRLDALRRFAGAVRRRSAHLQEMMPELRRQGFSAIQLDALARMLA